MAVIDWHERPELRRPHAVIAFEGWGDAAGASSAVAEFLVQQGTPDHFACLDPEEFYNFQMQRPTIQAGADGIRDVVYPRTELYQVELPEDDHDLVVVLGDEPSFGWRTFSAIIIEALQELNVDRVLTAGSFIGQVAHTLPVPVFGAATDPALIESHGLLPSDYEGPTGIIGVLNDELRWAEMPSLSLWAAVPHYLSANPYPKATYALLTKVIDILALGVDLTVLSKEVDSFEGKVNEVVEASGDLREYVKELEESIDDPSLGPAAGEQLVTEIEDFLQER